MLLCVYSDEGRAAKTLCMPLQDHVGELAGQCEAMLPRLATLAEQVTDEVRSMCAGCCMCQHTV